MSDERKLRLGVIGAGAWASFAHIPGFLRRPEVEPWVVNRRDPEALEAIRSRFGFAHATTDWREVIDLRPDIVALTGPGALRAEQAKAALEAGIHVLAEKPFTIDPADAWAIDRLARDRGLHVVLCYAWNEMGITEHARRLIEGPDGIGEVEHVMVEMATIVRDLLTEGTTYLGDADVSLPAWRDLVGPGDLRRGLRPGPAHPRPRAGDATRPGPPRDGRRGVHGRSGRRGRAPRRARHPLRGRGDRVGRRSVAAPRVVRQPAPAPDPHHRSSAARCSSTWRCRGSPARWAATDVEVELSDEDVRWSFDRVTDRMVDLVLGRTTDNPSPASLGARVVDILDGMYRSAASGRIEPVSRG